jgi:hypothetical protein
MSIYSATGTIVRQLNASPSAPPAAGGGDMTKIVYDPDNDGKVLAAENSDKLNAQAPTFYLSRENHTGVQDQTTVAGINTGETLADDITALYAGLSNAEASANKSNNLADSSSTVKFPVWAAIVSFFSSLRIQTILGVTNLVGIVKRDIGGTFSAAVAGTDYLVPGITTNYTPTHTGFSIPPTINAGECYYYLEGKRCTFVYYPSAAGTSNSTTVHTITLPFTAHPTGIQYFACMVQSGSLSNSPGRAEITPNTNILKVFFSNQQQAWTASGSKRAFITATYIIA